MNDYEGAFDTTRATSSRPATLRFRTVPVAKPQPVAFLGKEEGLIFLSPVLMGRTLHEFILVAREETVEVTPYASTSRAKASELTPNPSVELTHSGTAPWPFGSFVYSLPHGQGAAPARSAHLQR